MDKTVLITGASRGLGKELAEVFGEAGYDLILACKKSNNLYLNGQPLFTGDLRHPKTRRYLTDVVEARGIDILINNAAIYSDKPLLEMPEEEVKEIIDLNLTATILLTKAIWPIFQKQKSGMVVNINSTAGRSGSKDESIYCASKFGLRGFSEALQFEATKDSIQVLNVNVGAMKTSMTEGRKDWSKFIDPKEVAETVHQVCHNYTSLRLTEIDILRRKY